MTLEDMLNVETLRVPYEEQGVQRGKKKPYQAHHPHSQHHRRVHAQPEPAVPEPEILIDCCQTPDPFANPNDPFEQHFLAASLTPVQHTGHEKIRSSSFRNDKHKPNIAKRDSDLSNAGNFSSSPNLHLPKDDVSLDDHNGNQENREVPLCRVRSFKTTSKGGVVHRGDSFRKKNSNRNVASGAASNHDSPPRIAPAKCYVAERSCTPKAKEPPSSYFKVQLLGAHGCGKTSITNQFMSSDYANVYDNMNADDIERTVTIQLDGEETTMEFIDSLPLDDAVDHNIDVTADAYIIVYSVIDRVTFDTAVHCVYTLRHRLGSDRPIILVGNKIDLVRKRKVKKEDVHSISRTYDCLQFETSAALNHHVDELLVAILKQIRHKLNPDLYPSPEGFSEPEMRKSESKGPTGFLIKLCRRLSKKGRPTK